MVPSALGKLDSHRLRTQDMVLAMTSQTELAGADGLAQAVRNAAAAAAVLKAVAWGMADWKKVVVLGDANPLVTSRDADYLHMETVVEFLAASPGGRNVE